MKMFLIILFLIMFLIILFIYCSLVLAKRVDDKKIIK